MSITDRIVEESAKMFAREGIKAIRMDDIASELGISKRTIYELFKDKNTLIERSLIYHFAELDRLHAIRVADAKNVIEQFIIELENWDKSIPFNINLMEGVKKYYPDIYSRLVAERNIEACEQFKVDIVEGVRQGLFLDTINIDLAVSVFADSIFGVMSHSNQFLPNNISPSEAFKYIITYFFRGISTDKGIKILDNYINNKTNR